MDEPLASEPVLRPGQAGRAPVLVVLHQEHSTPGRLGHLLRAMGHRLDVRRPRFGDPLPTTLEHHAGAIVFGGPMSANDPDAFIRTEIDWLGVPLREGAPLIGICLGAQMLAAKLGQTIRSHPEDRVEMGYYPILPTPDADALQAAPFPRWVYHWHNEGFGLASGATCLATGDDFECQAFSYGDRAFGFQFHPEVTYAMICRWTVLGADRLGSPNAFAPRDHRASWFLHDAAVARWTRSFLEHWLAQPALVASV